MRPNHDKAFQKAKGGAGRFATIGTFLVQAFLPAEFFGIALVHLENSLFVNVEPKADRTGDLGIRVGTKGDFVHEHMIGIGVIIRCEGYLVHVIVANRVRTGFRLGRSSLVLHAEGALLQDHAKFVINIVQRLKLEPPVGIVPAHHERNLESAKRGNAATGVVAIGFHPTGMSLLRLCIGSRTSSATATAALVVHVANLAVQVVPRVVFQGEAFAKRRPVVNVVLKLLEQCVHIDVRVHAIALGFGMREPAWFASLDAWVMNGSASFSKRTRSRRHPRKAGPRAVGFQIHQARITQVQEFGELQLFFTVRIGAFGAKGAGSIIGVMEAQFRLQPLLFDLVARFHTAVRYNHG
mmetsp:Transcript_8144/g.17253  ORF Transcript_8144/g.17253 Transcript_8144/m.17253 type:complete len:352 (-) Transcript_8144:58-1113(-)